jgi:hypothetical protein
MRTAVDTVKESPTEALMRMAGIERVILGSDGRSYALVSAHRKVECRELKSNALRNLLTHAALKATGKLPTPEAIAAVVGALEANAEFKYVPETASLGVARGPSRSSYLLDLADREGWIVEIRSDGWELVNEPSVFFRRATGQHALPLPVEGGSLELLKKYVNVEDYDWPLFIGRLRCSLRPVGPHPILVATGEQGADKTTAKQPSQSPRSNHEAKNNKPSQSPRSNRHREATKSVTAKQPRPPTHDSGSG